MMTLENVLNRIKASCGLEWLAPSQRALYDRIAGGCSSHSMINVYGSKGTGKTFLGWVLAGDAGSTYTFELDVSAWGRRAILDIPSLQRDEARRTRTLMMLGDCLQVVVLTRAPVPDDILKFELNLSADDMRVVKHNFLQYLGCQLLLDGADLHELVEANIRGGHIA